MNRTLTLLSALLLTLFCAISCVNRTRTNDEAIPEGIEIAEEDDRNEQIPVFHQWVQLASDYSYPPYDFFFEELTQERERKWEVLCEERNAMESTSKYVDLGGFANVNQYVTVNDFIELWYREDSYLQDDDFITWRLIQYDSQPFEDLDSEYDKFMSLKNNIQSLLLYSPGSQFDINCHSGLESDFQEYFDRLMYRNAIRHSDKRLADALEREEKAWLRYHAALNLAFRIIDGSPTGWVGSGWPMAVCGIAYNNAQMRALSLEDFYFALTDSLDYQFAHKRSMIGQYDIERHETISNDSVVKEYVAFMEFLRDEDYYDPEYYYPVSERRKALDNEMKAWQAWMTSREAVSSILTGLCKDCYDNSTNNVRRHKLIMLKNRYQGFGLTSPDILEIILPYDCDDSDIQHYNFEDKYRSITN